MSYFRGFPTTFYKFGDEKTDDVFRNIAIYADVIDQIKTNLTAYENYNIGPSERPDQSSYKLYGTVDYYWTFFMMNAKLREQGWPLSRRAVYDLGQSKYNQLILTTRTELTDRFKVGQIISGNISGHSGKIVHREIDLGQLYISSNTGDFTAGETIESTNSSGVVETIVLNSTSIQANAAHHYENASGHNVDIDPRVGPGAGISEVTWLERLINENDELTRIRVIRSQNIKEVSEAFKRAIKT